jgi:hypothetical protein
VIRRFYRRNRRHKRVHKQKQNKNSIPRTRSSVLWGLTVVDMKHQNIGETIIRLSLSKGKQSQHSRNLPSLVQHAGASANRRPQRQPVLVSPQQLLSDYALCYGCANPPPSGTPPKKLCLSHLCRNRKHSRQPRTNIPATEHACQEHACRGTSHRSVCLVVSPWQSHLTSGWPFEDSQEAESTAGKVGTG